MSVIAWSELAPSQVESFISTLLVHTVDGAVAVDGSGGDDGADVVVATADGQRVWEIKSFRTRLNGPQKRQIVKSLETAVAKRSPLLAWTLVLPLDFTPAEQRWFAADLALAAPGVPLDWMGLTALEGVCAHNPALLRQLPRSAEARAIELVKQMGQEKAALSTVADAIERTRALRNLTEDLDPDWAADFTFSDGHTAVALRPKDPGTLARRPIATALAFHPPADAAQAAALTALREYGTGLTVPGELVASLTIDLPPAMAGLLPDDAKVIDLSLVPPLVEGVRGQLTASGVSGVVAKLPVQLREQTAGERGIRLVLTDDGAALTIEATIDQDNRGGFAVTFSADGQLPGDALPALRFLTRLAEADKLNLTLAGFPTLHSRMTGTGIDLEAAAQALARLELLDRVQDRLGEPFEVPSTLSDSDVATLSLLDQLLDGTAMSVPWPLRRPFDFDSNFMRTVRASSGPFPRGTIRLIIVVPFHIAGRALNVERDVIIEARDLVMVNLAPVAAILAQDPTTLPATVTVWMAPDDRTSVMCHLAERADEL